MQLSNASSDWLARMDADDLMFPDRLKRQMGVIKQRPELMFVGTDYALLTPFGHVFERRLQDGSCEVDVSRLGKGRFFADPSTIFNRRVALAVGGVDPEFTMGDVPLWFRMLSRGKGWEIAEPLHLYRIQPNSMSKGLDFFRQGMRVRAKYAPESVHLYRQPQEDDVRTGWYNIAALEFLAGENQALRNAIEFLRPEAPRTAHRMGLLSRFGRYGRKLYQWRNPWLNSFTRRPDWEQLFAPFIQRDTRKRNDDGTACYDLVSPLPE